MSAHVPGAAWRANVIEMLALVGAGYHPDTAIDHYEPPFTLEHLLVLQLVPSAVALGPRNPPAAPAPHIERNLTMPRPSTDSEQLNVRLPREAIAQADDLIPHAGQMLGLIKPTRADVLRSAIMRGLREMQLERAAAGGGRRRKTGS